MVLSEFSSVDWMEQLWRKSLAARLRSEALSKIFAFELFHFNSVFKVSRRFWHILTYIVLKRKNFTFYQWLCVVTIGVICIVDYTLCNEQPHQIMSFIRPERACWPKNFLEQLLVHSTVYMTPMVVNNQKCIPKS